MTVWQRRLEFAQENVIFDPAAAVIALREAAHDAHFAAPHALPFIEGCGRWLRKRLRECVMRTTTSE